MSLCLRWTERSRRKICPTSSFTSRFGQIVHQHHQNHCHGHLYITSLVNTLWQICLSHHQIFYLDLLLFCIWLDNINQSTISRPKSRLGKREEKGGGSWRRKTGRDDGRGFGCAWWLDFWPGWRIKYQQIILLMWANHYHRNPTLPPVEISFSGRLNTFVGNLSLGQFLEIILSLFKWWNLMFSYWTLMFGMYL